MKGNVTKIKTVKCAGPTQAKANTSSRLAAFHFHVHFHLPQSAWLTSGSGQKLPLDCLFITLGTALAYSHTQTHTQKEEEGKGKGLHPHRALWRATGGALKVHCLVPQPNGMARFLLFLSPSLSSSLSAPFSLLLVSVGKSVLACFGHLKKTWSKLWQRTPGKSFRMPHVASMGQPTVRV